jgi:GT2 family glycosyltransferase
MNPKVSIIILNWNGLKDTIECLESLKKITYPNYKVIIVDNGSRGNDADVLEERYKGCIELIRNKENLGFTGGNNVAIHYLLKRNPPDYVFLLNNDTKIEKDCLSYLVRAIQKSGAGIVGAHIKKEGSGEIQPLGRYGSFPLLRQFFDPLFHWPRSIPKSGNDFWECFWVCGAAILIQREVLEKVYALNGYYLNEKLFIYGDELDFCTTAKELGYKTIVAKRAIVYHKVAKSMGGRYNPIEYYYTTRNHILLAPKLLPLPLKVLFYPFCFLAAVVRILKNITSRRFYSALAIIYGLWDGYRGVTGKWKYHEKMMLKWTQ